MQPAAGRLARPLRPTMASQLPWSPCAWGPRGGLASGAAEVGDRPWDPRAGRPHAPAHWHALTCPRRGGTRVLTPGPERVFIECPPATGGQSSIKRRGDAPPPQRKVPAVVHGGAAEFRATESFRARSCGAAQAYGKAVPPQGEAAPRSLLVPLTPGAPRAICGAPAPSTPAMYPDELLLSLRFCACHPALSE